jgi:hypothetical protein
MMKAMPIPFFIGRNDMTPSTYDQRSTSEIRDDLLAKPMDEIDVIAALIVLCDRIFALESKINFAYHGSGALQ